MNPSFFFLSLLTIFFAPLIVSSSSPYSEQCDSIVPESIPTVPDYSRSFPFYKTIINHYTGGERILGNASSSQSSSFDSVLFLPAGSSYVYRTNTSGVYSLKADLIFSDGYRTPKVSHRTRPLTFMLSGFWSSHSGKLCMVGSASWYSEQQGINSHKLEAVLKLNWALNSTIDSSLVTGTLVSLNSSSSDPNFFQPISILGFAASDDYNYTLFSDKGCSSSNTGGMDIPKNQSLGIQPTKFCFFWSRKINFELEYSNECTSSKNCTPLGSHGIEFLPPVMSLHTIQCSEVEQKVRYLLAFGNSSQGVYSQHFDPSTSLVAEGSWDGNKNQLCIVACQILNSTNDLGNAHVGDCSIRLSLRYPAFWSIRNRNTIVGQIWTNKTVNESGYFNRIMFETKAPTVMVSLNSGLRYEYTETDRLRKLCPPVKKTGKRNGETYPRETSYAMRFGMSVKESKRNLGWGNAVPIFAGDQMYGYIQRSFHHNKSEVAGNRSAKSPLNISYTISITKSISPMSVLEISSSTSSSFFSNGRAKIYAEGVYDGEIGHLCMVGCRELGSEVQKSTNVSMDCDLLLEFQFPPANSKKGGFIKGSIESLRKNTDPLYFERLTTSSTAFYTTGEKKTVQRLDLEVTMVLISNTLACVFVGLQLFYVKKNPEVLSFMSLIMLVILCLGHMIPLVLNYEALFLGNRNRRNVLLGIGGWLEVNEVVVRVVTMVAFLLQFRLLQLACSARLGDENQKGFWIAEKETLFVSLPLYIVGLLIALIFKLGKNSYNNSLWGTLRSYGGLVLDGFLFPQILLNVFRTSRGNTLSYSFYLGITFVRLLPHAYDLYRAQNYARGRFDGSYIYANPSADFYSAAWDVIIPCGGVVFAVIIYLQQRFGGRCFLPRRFRESEEYKMVPVVSNTETTAS